MKFYYILFSFYRAFVARKIVTADAIRLKNHFKWKPSSDVCSLSHSHAHTHMCTYTTQVEGYTTVVGCLSVKNRDDKPHTYKNSYLYRA